MNTIPVFDGHNDTFNGLYRAKEKGKAFTRPFGYETSIGHIDYPRAVRGGLAGGFFAIYVANPEEQLDLPEQPANDQYWFPLPPPLDHNYANGQARGMVDSFLKTAGCSSIHHQKIRIARTVADLEQNFQNPETLSVIMHFEGAEPFPAIDYWEQFDRYYQLGMRSLGIVWSRPNAFGHGVPFAFPTSPDTGPGLTKLGKKLVKVCNQYGVMIDVSHLTEKGFWDVARLSDAPVVATHSCVHAISPSSRNLTDEQLYAIRDSNGVVGINFCVGFLREDGRNDPNTPLSQIVKHVRYVTDLIGIDHVALGSDFDGATIPNELKDVAGLPKLINALRTDGFSEDELHKIGTQNWLRVLRQTWRDEAHQQPTIYRKSTLVS